MIDAKVTVRVPATSANIGAGFDTLGMALSMANTVEMQEADGCHITSADGMQLPAGPQNLVYRSAKAIYKQCGVPFSGLSIVQHSPIPLTRGLGSSSACIVAGMVGANALLKHPLSKADILSIAAKIEGHPDNVAPALLGGLVASCMQDGKVYSVKKEISPMLEFGVFIPDFHLSTEKARAALPSTVSRGDAVFNLSRAVLCQAALCEGRLDLLEAACDDALHQQYRLPLIPGGAEVFALARKAGALATFVSGAGPSVLAVVEKRNKSFWQNARKALQKAKDAQQDQGRFALVQLEADNEGVKIM